MSETTLVEREVSAGERKRLAKSGAAMRDGSFPIANEADLRNAIQAFGRARDKAAAKRHIIKRARALGKTALLPDDWKASLSEAAPDTLERTMYAVHEAVSRRFGKVTPDCPSPFVPIEATYPDHVVFRDGDTLWSVAYVATDDGIELGEPREVAVSFEPVRESTETEDPPRPAAESAADPAPAGAPTEIHEPARLLEAKEGQTGAAWDVLMIQEGTSGNGKHYPADVLRASVPLFEGVRAYADHPTKDEMRNRPERSIRDVVGWFAGVRYDDAERGIRGTFHVLESAGWLRQALKSAWDAGKRDLLGFSIHAMGLSNGKRRDGGILIEAIDQVISTDVVTTPGAGGRLLGVLESQRGADMDPVTEQAATATESPPAFDPAAFKAELLESVKAILKEAAPTPTKDDPDGDGDPPRKPVPPTREDPDGDNNPPHDDSQRRIQEAVAAQMAPILKRQRAVEIGARVDAAKLPPKAAGRLKARLLEALERRDVQDDEVDGGVAEYRELISESGPARPAALGATVAGGDDFYDRYRKGIDGFFQNRDVDGVRRFGDLKTIAATWLRESSGRQVDTSEIGPQAIMEGLRSGLGYDSETADREQLREALTTGSWGQVFADVLHKNMLREYNTDSKYNAWREVVSDVVSVPDFQIHRFIRTGGYADLEVVPEGTTYPVAASPTDEEVTFAVQKRGVIESVTWEMLQDMSGQQKVRLLPAKLARAAKRSLYKFVFADLIAGNPTMDYDSTALFHTDHANTDTSAGLAVGTMQTGRQKMRDQTFFNESSEVMGELNEPATLLIPNELQGLADRLTMRNEAYYAAIASNTNTDQALDPNLFRGRTRSVTVDVWTDANDWILVADPKNVHTIVMGFLNGREEPELFVQDNPTVGSVFTADVISYKIRMVWGGDVVDHRSFYRGQG